MDNPITRKVVQAVYTPDEVDAQKLVRSLITASQLCLGKFKLIASAHTQKCGDEFRTEFCLYIEPNELRPTQEDIDALTSLLIDAGKGALTTLKTAFPERINSFQVYSMDAPAEDLKCIAEKKASFSQQQEQERLELETLAALVDILVYPHEPEHAMAAHERMRFPGQSFPNLN